MARAAGVDLDACSSFERVHGLAAVRKAEHFDKQREAVYASAEKADGWERFDNGHGMVDWSKVERQARRDWWAYPDYWHGGGRMITIRMTETHSDDPEDEKLDDVVKSRTMTRITSRVTQDRCAGTATALVMREARRREGAVEQTRGEFISSLAAEARDVWAEEKARKAIIDKGIEEALKAARIFEPA